MNQRLENYPSEKLDVETDINGLRDLSTNFAKEKHDLQKQIHSLALEHETYRQLLTEIELEEMHIRKQIVLFLLLPFFVSNLNVF